MYNQQPPPYHPTPGGAPNQQILINPNLFPNLPYFIQQNPYFFPQQQFPPIPIPIPVHQQQQPHFPNFQPQPPVTVTNTNDIIEKLDKAVTKARRDIIASNENVSSWRVCQAALVIVNAQSWENLGFPMQQVNSLNDLLVTERKINDFIHCFVAARRITSLFDLETAICESEGIERFEELELGPLVRHPLAMQYFALTSDISEVYRITTGEIVSYLCKFLDTKKRKRYKVVRFLDFICKNQSASSRDKLCVRIPDFEIYVNHIKQVRQSEDNVLEKCYEKIKLKSDKKGKKRPLCSAQKKQMDYHFSSLAQRLETFSSENPQFGGKHIRFAYSSAEDGDNSVNENERNQDEENTENDHSLLMPNVKSDRVSSCPYPSSTEEMTRLRLKSEVDCSSPCIPSGSVDTELSQRKRRCENMDAISSLPHKLLKRDKFDTDLKHKGSGNRGVTYHSLPDESLTKFVTTWKEAGREYNADEVGITDSGAAEYKIESFILDSQNVPKLPCTEATWSLFQSSTESNYLMTSNNNCPNGKETTVKRKYSENILENANVLQSEMISSELNIEADPTGIVDTESPVSKSNPSSNAVGSGMTKLVLDSVDVDNYNMTVASKSRDDVFAQRAQLTGREGESEAYKYFVNQEGEEFVKWVNETTETGLPYDIILGDGDENNREYVEVKATKSARKNWFLISLKEWQFATEQGESYSIAHVNISDENMAKVTVYNNPARLCQMGNLKLALVVPNQP